MTNHWWRHRWQGLLSQKTWSLPLSNLRVIGRIFLSSIVLLWLLWMVDTLQQRDVLHLLTGGERVIEEMAGKSGEQISSQPAPEITLSPARQKAKRSTNSEEKKEENLQWLMGVFRMPVLIVLGILLPLALFLWNWESVIYTDTLKPYLMLLGAQAGSLIVGILLLGEGTVPFIGMVYSGLRVFQIGGLLDPRFHGSGSIPKPLRRVLRIAKVLWALNGGFLLLHILWVSSRLLQLHPSGPG